VQKKIRNKKHNKVIGQFPYIPIEMARQKTREIITQWVNGEDKKKEEEKMQKSRRIKKSMKCHLLSLLLRYCNVEEKIRR